MRISTDDAIECVLYAVAEKQKMGLDMEESVKVAKMELLNFWSRDMREIESCMYEIYGKK